MYAIYGNIYHQYTPNVSIYAIHGSYGIIKQVEEILEFDDFDDFPIEMPLFLSRSSWDLPLGDRI